LAVVNMTAVALPSSAAKIVPTTSGDVNPAMPDLAEGLKPTSPLMDDVGTLVTALPANTAKRPVDPSTTGAWPAVASM
jgi:hypothetical protein